MSKRIYEYIALLTITFLDVAKYVYYSNSVIIINFV
jgi:hypothetical protein